MDVPFAMQDIVKDVFVKNVLGFGSVNPIIAGDANIPHAGPVIVVANVSWR